MDTPAASARTTAPPVSAALASELVSLASRLLQLRSWLDDDPHDEELRRIVIRLGQLANGAAPRAPQAATATNGARDDAGAAHDPHGGAAGHTEPRPMRPDDVPGRILAAALAAWTGHDDPLNDCDVDDVETAATILAAVIPAIRAAIADEIEAEEAKIDRRSSDQASWHSNGMIAAANLIRAGDQ